MKNTFEKWNWKTPLWLNQFLAWATLPPIERNFQAINTSLRLLGKEQPLHATAVERAEVLQKTLPIAQNEITILLNEHQSALFSPRKGDETLARRASFTILVQAIYTRIKILILGYN
ncbi:MAG: hypothetical protein HC797_05565 [Anaerolineales bacterium]|nr:hypothetical protein [Anaerolineales bacterium]